MRLCHHTASFSLPIHDSRASPSYFEKKKKNKQQQPNILLSSKVRWLEMKSQEAKNKDKTTVKMKEKMKGNKKTNRKKGKDNKTLSHKKVKRGDRIKNTDKKVIKDKEPNFKVLSHELLAPFSQIPTISCVIFLYLSFHYQTILLPHYQPVPLWA
jgi:nucleosome binding factor SPN SPT16 subunit